MARIVLTCLGSYGDLFPALAIAKGLLARGDRPLLATSAHYRRIVEREGVDFHPVRPDVDPSNTELLGRVMDPAKGAEVLFKELVTPSVRAAFEDLGPVVTGADLLVTHPITFAGPLIAEARGVKWISTVLAPASFFSAYDFPVFPPWPAVLGLVRRAPWAARVFLRLAKRITGPWTADVRAFRRELGLPAAPDPLYEGQFSPYGTLALYSRVLGAPQQDWPPCTTLAGFPFFDGLGEMPADVTRFLEAGDPPVVFTLGSSAVGAAGSFFEESLEAVQQAGCRAVFLVGRDPRNRPARALPASVITAEYVPHATLFAHAAATVHHGGVGTLGQALRAGRPMLVVPHAHDQHDNARRAARLGVARVIDARKYRRGPVAAHLTALLADPTYRERAHEIGATVAAERAVDTACDMLRRYAGTAGTDEPRPSERR